MLEKAAIPQFLDILDDSKRIAKICLPNRSITEDKIKKSIQWRQKAVEKKMRKAAKNLKKGHKKVSKNPNKESSLAEELSIILEFSPAQQFVNSGEGKRDTAPPLLANKAPDKGLPSLFKCTERLKEKADSVKFQKICTISMVLLRHTYIERSREALSKSGGPDD